MLIRNSEEPIGTEIDHGIHGIVPTRHRVTIRKLGENTWQVVKYIFKTKKEEEIKRGTLKEVVQFVNLWYGYKDIAEEEMTEPRFKKSLETDAMNVNEKNQKHRCASIGCLYRWGKYFRDGKWYCRLHTPEAMKEKEEKLKKRQERARKVLESKMKTFCFRIGERVYESKGNSERHAWNRMFDKIIEIDHLGESKA